jgi:hypothetical protein
MASSVGWGELANPNTSRETSVGVRGLTPSYKGLLFRFFEQVYTFQS